jgi:SpoVK/Ycf46/Vps4 family AAA+-type ATPase
VNVTVEPIPLAEYQAYMTAYRYAAQRIVTPQRVRDVFSHLVISDPVLKQLGPAITDAHSMFMYGPPGNGKTAVAQAIHHLLEDEIAIPHAIDVNGHIIRVFDSASHQVIEEDSLERQWVRCRRPMMTVGGELSLAAFELTYDASAGVYRAPVQVVANGGLLVIDDVGRQRCTPRDLLSRWIGPLESRVDYLTLATGQSFEQPLALMVVFATNLEPSTLVDEAFLRRIHYKIFTDNPTPQAFRDIFKRCCERQDVPYDETLVDDLIEGFYRPRGVALRGCQPGDLIARALARAEHLGEPRRLTNDLLQSACAGYFVDETETTPHYA